MVLFRLALPCTPTSTPISLFTLRESTHRSLVALLVDTVSRWLDGELTVAKIIGHSLTLGTQPGEMAVTSRWLVVTTCAGLRNKFLRVLLPLKPKSLESPLVFITLLRTTCSLLVDGLNMPISRMSLFLMLLMLAFVCSATRWVVQSNSLKFSLRKLKLLLVLTIDSFSTLVRSKSVSRFTVIWLLSILCWSIDFCKEIGSSLDLFFLVLLNKI
mmetsp:Transcript_9114/g.12224  ORF Transcript_9114/g.12224 Transcript_9114/m.12224 type:complete len:214 (-) Transcript_9114:39-680(-)